MDGKDSGNLSEKAALPLLLDYHRRRASGQLKLERPPLQKAVYFREGSILFAASNDPKDQLASILVEEGKLTSDQMQMAQARVAPGNPLAKVLVDSGYLSQRELAEAARLKVEKILTDVFGWKEGQYVFAPGTLPKGAIDNLDLSTPALFFNSVRHLQNREWVLEELGSLDTVLSTTPSFSNFLQEARVDEEAKQVFELVDGVKTAKQIAAVSSLSEFDVCKILAGGLVLGAFTPEPQAAAEAPGPPPFSETQDLFGNSASPFEGPSPSSGQDVEINIEPPPIQEEEEPPMEPTIHEAAHDPQTGPPDFSSHRTSPPSDFEAPTSAGARHSPPTIPSVTTPFDRTAQQEDESQRDVRHLLIDEPEAERSYAEVASGLRRPRPRNRPRPNRIEELKKPALIAATVLILVGGGYFFVWPLVQSFLSPEESQTPSASPTQEAPAAPGPTAPSTANAITSTAPSGKEPSNASPAPTPPGASSPSATPPAAPTSPPNGAQTPSPRPQESPPSATAPTPSPRPTTPTSPVPRDPRPGATSPTPDAPVSPTPGAGATGMERAHQLLRGGSYPEAARQFHQHLRQSAADKYTIALASYCNTDNVSRAINNAGSTNELFILPFTEQGRTCYRVVWGVYDSSQTARRQLSAIPSSIRQPDSQPVPLAPLIQ